MKRQFLFIFLVLTLFFCSITFVNAEDSAVTMRIEGLGSQVDDVKSNPQLKVKLSTGEYINDVTWKVSDDEALEIDSQGRITFKSGGFVLVTAINEQYGQATLILYINDLIEMPDGSKMYPMDFNMNGVIDMDDARFVLRLAVSSEKEREEYIRAGADVNFDGKVDVIDAREIMSIAERNIFHTAGKYNPITTFKFNETNGIMKRNQNKTLTLVMAPEDTTDSKIVTWSSSNESVAEVDQTGRITTKNEGGTIISATLKNGKKAEYRLIVEPRKKGDVDKNDVVDAVDASKILTLYKNQNADVYEEYLGDVDGTPGLSAVDAMTILTAFKNKTDLE